MSKKKFSLFNAITMIVGICVGSGIFFKADNILESTNGSIMLGVLLFIIAATAIIFGSLTIAVLSRRTDKPGGIISYAEEFVGKKFALGLGWFMTLIYYPTITAVVSWVIGIYVDILFNLNASLLTQVLIGYGFVLLSYLYNILAPKLGAIFQNMATIIKLIPLLVVGLIGLIYGDPVSGLASINKESLVSVGFLTALGPIAYSFDGWIVSTSVAHEIHNAKKNLPLALTIAPLIVLLVYILYFVGISSLVGPDLVISLGDAHVSYAASLVFGPWFSKAITIFVVISIMGTCNGLIMGYIRMPYHLALRDWLVGSKSLTKLNKHNIPINSALCSLLLLTLWLIVHYIVTKFNLFGKSDVSEIAITVSYIFYSVLYLRVYKLYKDKEVSSKLVGIFLPTMALIGSVIILTGAIQIKSFGYYLLFSGFIYLLSQIYYKKKES